MKRFVSVILVCMMLVICFGTASAAGSASSSGSGGFTVTTGKKDATLKLSITKGKFEGTAWKNILKQTQKKVTGSSYGKFVITGAGDRIVIESKSSKSITLKKNSTYQISVSFDSAIPQLDTMKLGAGKTASWDNSWTKYPKWKATINNSAKITQ